MIKIGLEKEFFLVNQEGKPYILSGKMRGLPCDECGWLVEARGLPYESVTEAVFSLKADIYEIEQRVKNTPPYCHNSRLDDTPVMVIDRKMRIEAARTFAKPMVKYGNFYGHQHHATKGLEATAGVHVSFTSRCPISVNLPQGIKTEYYNANFDWPRIFIALDEAFKDEIKEAKRKPGFYELKTDGRVEYRSLPSNVNLDKLIVVLKKILPEDFGV